MNIKINKYSNTFTIQSLYFIGQQNIQRRFQNSKLCIIQKYKSKLLNHLLWIDENVEHMSHTEKMLFDLHLSVLKDIIKDLEEMK